MVLFDEVDKAHPDVLTIMLQLFDEVPVHVILYFGKAHNTLHLWGFSMEIREISTNFGSSEAIAIVVRVVDSKNYSISMEDAPQIQMHCGPCQNTE